jgi:hypothetical protein
MKCALGRKTVWSISGPRRERGRASPRTNVTPTPMCSARSARHATSQPHSCFRAPMQLHLDQISRCVAGGAHAVITLDKAGWHTTRKLQLPSNISLVHMPPASPELNPTENVWQYMRQSYLSNQVFRDYDDVVEASSLAWNKLIAENGRIASIGTRSWAVISQDQ